jgi:hypothetical protein
MAKWTLSGGKPVGHESRRVVRNTETGAEGFAAVHHSSDGRPHLYGAVYRPRLDTDGGEVGLPDGTPDTTVLDTDPEYV